MNPPGIKGCLYNFLTDVKISRQGHSFFFKFIIAQITGKIVSVKK